jgi:hypothetical protein
LRGSPRSFVSVGSKRVRNAVSLLKSTLTSGFQVLIIKDL